MAIDDLWYKLNDKPYLQDASKKAVLWTWDWSEIYKYVCETWVMFDFEIMYFLYHAVLKLSSPTPSFHQGDSVIVADDKFFQPE